jgi:NAD-dependent DNA ligase
MGIEDFAAAQALARRRAAKACEHLTGIVTGVVADQQLADLEIQFLSMWLTENQEATAAWPGSVIHRKVREVLADGVITEEERAHLLDVLRSLASSDFSLTGSAAAEVAALPINDDVTVALRHAGVCHTGEFLFGTRAACERATLSAGGMPLDSVTRRTDLLVIGTRVSSNWASTSFGRKIQKAAELQEAGHAIEIVSERRWLEALQ